MNLITAEKISNSCNGNYNDCLEKALFHANDYFESYLNKFLLIMFYDQSALYFSDYKSFKVLNKKEADQLRDSIGWYGYER